MRSEDLVEVVLAEGRKRIQVHAEAKRKREIEEVRQQLHAAQEERINQYYVAQARVVSERLWQDCRRELGHVPRAVDMNEFGRWRYICEACGCPSGADEDSRKKNSIAELAARLRRADQKAHVEYIPEVDGTGGILSHLSRLAKRVWLWLGS